MKTRLPRRPYDGPSRGPGRERQKRPGRARLRTLLAASAALLPAMAIPSTAVADTPGCSAANHCYSVLDAHGTSYSGMYGTWNRAHMNPGGATTSNHRFINSEMWLSRGSAATSPWVEVGMKHGYFIGNNAVGFIVFGEWINGASRGYKNFGTISPNDSVTDEYQISHGNQTNGWHVYFDGILWATGVGPGFWSSSQQHLGAEVATAYGAANLFTMYGKGITNSGSKVNFGTDGAWAGNNTTVLAGNRPADSTWKWKVK